MKITQLTDEEIDKIIIHKIASQPAKGGKATNCAWKPEELEIRNYVVLQLITKQGMSRTVAARHLADRWGCSLGTAKKYIKEALQELVADYKDYEDTARQDILEKLQHIYNDAVHRNQTKVALTALEQINKILGLYTEKKDVNVRAEPLRLDFD